MGNKTDGNLKFYVAGGLRAQLNTASMTFNVADVQIASKLSHVGDTNTFLNFGADTLGITTGGTERIAVSNTGLDVTGAITVSGTVDGRDVATDGTKLDDIEALADVTDTANVVAALTAGTNIAIASNGTISSTDTNTTYSVGDGGLTQKNFTTTLNTKLGDIEALADVTDTANVVAALTAGTNVAIASNGTISSTDTNTTYSVGDGGLTQKNFTTALNTKLGDIEALADVTDTTNVVAALTAGTNIAIASNGTISSTDTNTTYSVGDGGLTQKNFTTTLKTKLGGIAENANAYTFPYTVSSAESVSTVVQRQGNGYIFASYFNGSGTFSTTGTNNGMGRFTGTNGTDTYGRSYTAAAARTLLNVENGATADQTAAQLLTAIKTVDGAGSGLDADKLDGQTSGSFLRSNAADSFSGTITMATQVALVANNYGRGLFGLYSAARYQHVWSMGAAYKTSDDGASYGNMYGLTYTHTNVGTAANQAIAGLSHQLQHRTNGTLTAAIGSGIWTSGNITAYSDIAVKTNLVKIPNALEKVCSINGYTYERTDYVKDPEDSNAPDILRQAGVVAQEVEKVLPEVVSGEDGNKAVAYGNMVAILIEAIKEQQIQIDELKKTLKEIN